MPYLQSLEGFQKDPLSNPRAARRCAARGGMAGEHHKPENAPRLFKEDVREFIAFTALQDYMRLRSVGRSHIISWRKDMERRGLAPASIRRKLSALSSLFDYLCERNAVIG